jgi:hypothetical protein
VPSSTSAVTQTPAHGKAARSARTPRSTPAVRRAAVTSRPAIQRQQAARPAMQRQQVARPAMQRQQMMNRPVMRQAPAVRQPAYRPAAVQRRR